MRGGWLDWSRCSENEAQRSSGAKLPPVLLVGARSLSPRVGERSLEHKEEERTRLLDLPFRFAGRFQRARPPSWRDRRPRRPTGPVRGVCLDLSATRAPSRGRYAGRGSCATRYSGSQSLIRRVPSLRLERPPYFAWRPKARGERVQQERLNSLCGTTFAFEHGIVAFAVHKGVRLFEVRAKVDLGVCL